MAWLNLITLVLLVHAADDAVKLPRDMSALVERMKACGKVWAIEPKPSRVPKPGEGQRLERFRADLAKHRCGTLDRDLAQMRVKYAQNADIVRLCDRFMIDPRSEATRMASTAASAEAHPPAATQTHSVPGNAKWPLSQTSAPPPSPTTEAPTPNPTNGQAGTANPFALPPTGEAPTSNLPTAPPPSVDTDSTHK